MSVETRKAKDSDAVRGTRIGFYVKKLVVEICGEDGKEVIEIDTHMKFRTRSELDTWMKQCGMLP